MIYSELHIEYSDPTGVLQPLTLRFKLNNFPIVEKWVNKVVESQEKYKIDDPRRFYSFNDNEVHDAIERINNVCDIINTHGSIINRKVTYPIEQDTLNYLHHIFEVYHGLLDKQEHPFYVSASDEVKLALRNLNIEVHRCESLVNTRITGNYTFPRHVVTWFDLKKHEQFDIADYDYFDEKVEFGSIYINYVEIGKSLEHLSTDFDDHIGSEAFKPFRYYSSDFVVKFYELTDDYVLERKNLMRTFYDDHLDFFNERNLPFDHPYNKAGSIPVATLIRPEFDVLTEIAKRQMVTKVTLID